MPVYWLAAAFAQEGIPAVLVDVARPPRPLRRVESHVCIFIGGQTETERSLSGCYDNVSERIFAERPYGTE